MINIVQAAVADLGQLLTIFSYGEIE